MTYEEFADMFKAYIDKDLFLDDDGMIFGTEEERAELVRLLEEKIVSSDDVEKLKYVVEFFGTHGFAYNYIRLIKQIDDFEWHEEIRTPYDLGKYLVSQGKFTFVGDEYEKLGEDRWDIEGSLTPVGYAILKDDAYERYANELLESSF